MTKIIRDSIDTNCSINGSEWKIVEAEVSLTQSTAPNYVDINHMIPTSDVSTPSSEVDTLIGSDASLKVKSDLETNRSGGETTLFKGKLANISAIGDKRYEALFYDPSQQPLAGSSNTTSNQDGENQEDSLPQEASVGSLINQRIDLVGEEQISADNPTIDSDKFSGLVYIKRASDVIDTIIENVSTLTEDNVDNQLLKGGRVYNNGTIEAAYDRRLKFDQHKPKVKTVIRTIEERCECDFWFDRKGILHIGVPQPTVYNLELIKKAADGFTTPPYKSVRVVGSLINETEAAVVGEPDSGTLSSGVGRKKVTVEKYLPLEDISGGKNINPKSLEDGQNIEDYEPTFEYRNDSITTKEQAESTSNRLLRKIGEQYAEGNITIVGLADIEPFDVVKMPQADNESKDNYQPNKPMGGARYGVYSVKHRLNGDDGFVTKVNITAPVGHASSSGSEISEEEKELTKQLEDLDNTIKETRSEIPSGQCSNNLFDMEETAEEAITFSSNSSPKQVPPKLDTLDSQLSDLRECRKEAKNIPTSGLSINEKIQSGGALQEKINETRNKADNAITAGEPVDSSADLQGRISTDRYDFDSPTIDSSADLTAEISGDSGGSVENVEDTEDTEEDDENEDDESDDDRLLSGSERGIDTTDWFDLGGGQTDYRR